LLSELISVIPQSEYESFIPAASTLLPGHPKDIPYFALALKLMAPVWSNEKRFKKQSQIVVYSTTELKQLFDI
jgi:predicted nucleic acid-binding protein